MLVVYVAGPFTGPSAWDIAENVRAAERIGLMIARAGAMPLIPHANTSLFHGQNTHQFWLDGTMELLRRCDGAVFTPSWRQSSGAKGEFEESCRLLQPHLCLDDISERFLQSMITDFVAQLEDKFCGKEHQAEEPRTSPQTAGH